MSSEISRICTFNFNESKEKKTKNIDIKIRTVKYTPTFLSGADPRDYPSLF